MKFEEKPDIAYLRKLFKDLFFRFGYEYDFVFDWMVKKPQAQPALGQKTEDENHESSKAIGQQEGAEATAEQ